MLLGDVTRFLLVVTPLFSEFWLEELLEKKFRPPYLITGVCVFISFTLSETSFMNLKFLGVKVLPKFSIFMN